MTDWPPCIPSWEIVYVAFESLSGRWTRKTLVSTQYRKMMPSKMDLGIVQLINQGWVWLDSGAPPICGNDVCRVNTRLSSGLPFSTACLCLSLWADLEPAPCLPPAPHTRCLRRTSTAAMTRLPSHEDQAKWIYCQQGTTTRRVE